MDQKPGETKDQAKGQTTDAAKSAEADKDLLSLNDLDALIAKQDPEFGGEVTAIQEAAPATAGSIELLDLDALLAEQEANSLKSRLRRLGVKIRNLLVGLKATVIDFVKHELPVLAKQALGKLKAGLEHLREAIRQFGFKSRRYKIFFSAFVALCGLAGAGLYVLLTRGIPTEDRLFMQSLEEVADSSIEFDPKAEQEAYYDSTRAAQNILVVPKLVVNLRTSEGSSSNPMVAMELYVEGNSPDVVIEVKARETEFRDAFMRTMEEFRAADLESALGKQKLLERLAREANRLATKGRIKRVFYKTFVLKI